MTSTTTASAAFKTAASVITRSSSSRGTLLTCRRGHADSILVAALHRPEVKNAFNDALYLDLIDILQEATQDDTIAAVVLTGTGTYFSSGADLKETSQLLLSFESSSDDDDNNETSRHHSSVKSMLHRPPGQFMMALLQFPKVVVAAVNGPAVGIAVTLLFHCDIVACSPQATFWAPFTRLALVPEFCSSVTMAETMGLSKANELLLLGKKIDATTALAWNMVSQILPAPTNYNNNRDTSMIVDDDPFAPNSTASLLSEQLDQHLLSLPLGPATAKLFVSMMRGKRRDHLVKVCQDELRQLDARFERGDVLQAASQLSFGKTTSKL